MEEGMYMRKEQFDITGMTCSAENEGSRKAIAANGGVFESTMRLEEENETLERYWIEL